MSPIDKLTHIFKLFPGIGERQARRFVYFLLSRDADVRTKLATAITELGNTISQCADCKRFYPHLETQKEVCVICADTTRDSNTIMIVEKDTDLENIERSKTYTGRYFVLGGVAPMLANTLDEVDFLRPDALTKLLTRIKPQEVIFGFATSAEGEHTAELLGTLLAKQKFTTPFTISKLGRGLSAGAELEYADPTTLKAALETRTQK